MRHVPEEELHPYLDQALSRSQCVEIETHLAECGHCRDQRDNIAALRDRTTAILGQLTPRNLIIPPPFEALAERLSKRPVTPLWQIRLKRASLWAAGVMAAVGAGWAGRSLLDPHRAAPSGIEQELAPLGNAVELGSAIAPGSTSMPADPIADLAAQATELPLPESRPSLPTSRSRALRVANVTVPSAAIPAPMLQLASGFAPVPERSRDMALTGATTERITPFGPLWRQVQWEDALEQAGGGLPYIEGLLVVGVLLHPGAAGERPTALVAQQDPSGEIILSIEGPTDKVSALVRSQATPELHASEVTRTTPDYITVPGSPVRRVNRVLAVTGRLSVDSLNALARLATIR
jgi:hypothetical protein